jgi:tetratricopeptide (TPR) repeat protein
VALFGAGRGNEHCKENTKLKKMANIFLVLALTFQALVFFVGCNADYYSDRGFNYYMKDDYDRAIVNLTKAVELDPNNVSHYFWRAAVYEEKSDYDNAMADLEKMDKIDPETAYNGIYKLDEKINECIQKAVKEQKYDAVIKGYTLLIKRKPDDLAYYEGRIDAVWQAGIRLILKRIPWRS